MIKFYHKLLLILTTITVVSFMILGFVIHNTIDLTVEKYQKKEAHQEAEQLLARYFAEDRQDIRRLAELFEVDVTIMDTSDEYHVTVHSTSPLKAQTQPLLQKLKTENNVYQLNRKTGVYTYAYKEDNTAILLSGQSKVVSDLQLQFWKYLVVIGLFTMALIFFTVRYINRTYIQPINEVSYAASLLSEGKYHIRVPESSVKETKELYVTINVLARRLDKLNSAQKIERNRLVTTLENIPSAILMIDKHGDIVLANKTYCEIFNNGKYVEQQNYEAILNPVLKQLVVEGFKVEKAMYQQIEMHVNDIHQKFFDASCVPILTRKRKKLQGMVIVLHDITQLKKLENLRRDFVANVSHELRTPITSIKGFAETLIDGAKNDPQSLDMFLNIILKESNRIQSLVEDLLDLSKIEQNTTLERHRIHLSEVARGAMSVIEPIAQAKHITLVDAIDDDVYAMADEDKIAQVIVNLMTNAVNYSYAHKTVTLRVFEEQQQQVIEVIDEGIGIHQDEKYHIFERFYRVDKARSRDSGGTGLGLSITKHIVEAYQGKIEVDSEEGRGSTFRVILMDPDK
ncbi:two-component system histidine kinase PnpS [Staphylococcus sp. 17KM0847]|uniref:two-component system histidine kinase PnpS n=1 Tax=Staphylococcus sp. 17KM0847 TaxID=2583989 RepID=UPI0015DBD5E3|nr:ATP-binding protein [Staphylococcus sp. 17KM0847]QLK85947.1 GHKL domain-containing protein [Staphylococcus sp. 17KM0847]